MGNFESIICMETLMVNLLWLSNIIQTPGLCRLLTAWAWYSNVFYIHYLAPFLASGSHCAYKQGTSGWKLFWSSNLILMRLHFHNKDLQLHLSSIYYCTVICLLFFMGFGCPKLGVTQKYPNSNSKFGFEWGLVWHYFLRFFEWVREYPKRWACLGK